jgi:F-type H+-transporting ATPase subunit b
MAMNETIPNKEIIDATQNAVLNAVSNVAAAVDNTVQELSSHSQEPFYLEAEFWVGAAFVLVVLLLMRPVGKALLGMLHGRADAIRNRIDEAVTLKEEAQKLLADYERKFRGVEKEVSTILTKSEREIESVKKENLANLEHEMAQKEQEAKARLKVAEDAALREIAAKTSDLTMQAVRQVLDDSLDERALSQLIDKSIANLEEAVH